MTLSRLELGFESPWGRQAQVRYCRMQCRIFCFLLINQAYLASPQFVRYPDPFSCGVFLMGNCKGDGGLRAVIASIKLTKAGIRKLSVSSGATAACRPKQ